MAPHDAMTDPGGDALRRPAENVQRVARIQTTEIAMMGALTEYLEALREGAPPNGAAYQDVAANFLVRLGRVALPQSALMQKAAAAGLASDGPKVKDDDVALVEMGRLVLEGIKPKPASLQVIELAAPGSASPENVAHRILRKFRKDPLGCLIAAGIAARGEAGVADSAYNPHLQIHRVIHAYHRILRGERAPAPWTAGDLAAWQRRCGMRTDAEAADALGVSESAYRRKKNGKSRIRQQESWLARLIEIGLTEIDGSMLAIQYIRARQGRVHNPP